MKFCKDCKFYKPALLNALFNIPDKFANCAHTESIDKAEEKYYLVTGKSNHYNYCAVMRISSCGGQAGLFESKRLKR